MLYSYLLQKIYYCRHYFAIALAAPDNKTVMPRD